MKKQLLDQIIKKKENKDEFAIITYIANGESCIFEKNFPLDKNFNKYSEQINNFFNKNKNGIIENTDIFVETYTRPIKVIIVGAVHIAQYLVGYAKSLNIDNFDLTIDWGILYFLTKPLFFAIDYFF